MKKELSIAGRIISEKEPAYFIADVGSNFDGSLEEAKNLVKAVKDSGADAVKFQSFLADKIVSSESFKEMKIGFQERWSKPTYQVYKEAEFPREWHKEIAQYAKEVGIHFLSSPYDKEAVDLLEEIGVPAYKIGSGDIDWPEMLEYIAKKGKPIFLATGASSLEEVKEAVEIIKKYNQDIAVLQCITNYPSKAESANINVLDTYKSAFDCLVGYSDHSPGDTVVLGAIAKGAKVIEKHFTLDKSRVGPDHPHSMNPEEFKEMVRKARDLEKAMGSPVKEVVLEEKETAIIQRRSLHASTDLKEGDILDESKIIELRPAVGISPKDKGKILGKRINKSIKAREKITWQDIKNMNNFKDKIEHSKDIIRQALSKYPKTGVACSFGKDSMVVAHLAREVEKTIPIFSVMTKFKPLETLNYLAEMNSKFNFGVKVYMVADSIPETFAKAGIETVLLSNQEFSSNWERAQKESSRALYEVEPDTCCRILKVDPTKEAVKGLDAWITGLRRTEGYTREDYQEVEKRGELIKINPILDWTELDIWRYMALNQIPANPLYGQGYRSLGCAPCSKIVADTEAERAGRWQGTSKCGGECGIHTQNLK